MDPNQLKRITDFIVEDIRKRGFNNTLHALLGIPDFAGRNIWGNLGDFQAQANLQSLLAALGIPDVAGKPLYTCIVTDRLGAVGDAAAEAGTLLPRLKFYGQGIIKGTGTEIPADKSLYDAIGLVLARANNPSLYGMLGVADVAGRSLTGNLGDFQAQANLQSLLAALGIPDVAGKPLYTCIITDRLDHATYGLSAHYAKITGATGIFFEQTDVAVNINAIAGGETDVLNLAAANTRYIVRHLRLKCANPGANQVLVRLYELINDVLTNVDTFTIDNTNFGTYFSLMDMFGVSHLAGDQLQVTVQASAGGPYAVTGQYSSAKTNV